MIMLKVIFACFACIFVGCDSTLSQRKINASAAFCNDGSQAVFYYDDDGRCTEGNQWVIFFEGGGGCRSISQCIDRMENERTRVFVSSKSLPPSVTGEDVLSLDKKQNRYFYDYCHVMVPYCTSDFWLGNMPQHEFQGRNISFLGATVLKAAILNLIDIGLGNVTEVVLYGVSAGTIGILNHLQWIQSHLPGVNLSLVLDSGLFLNYKNVYRHLYSEEIAEQFVSAYPLCQKKDEFGVPHCVLPSCLLLNLVNASVPPTLFISSMYDSYLLNFILQDSNAEGDTSASVTTFLTRSINEVYSYGSALLSHATLLHCSLPHVSFVMPSCTQHYFVASSSMWGPGGVLNSAVGMAEAFSNITVRNDIRPGLWDAISINGTSIHDYIGLWKGLKSHTSVFITDSCKSLFCSSGCQDLVKLASKDFTISQWWEWLFVTIGLVLVYGPLCPKGILLFQQKWLFWLQRKYVKRSTVRTLNKQGSLFTSVSCSGLTYRPYSNLGFKNRMKGLFSSVSVCGVCSRKVAAAPSERVSSNDRVGILSSDYLGSRSSEANTKKDIIRDVNLYINPGELVAIMGPTGSGKTTLLDVLLGRRAGGVREGNVFIQGIPLISMKKWFQDNSGYVRQLAVPYYEELTVRENLVLSANMQMPPNTSTEQLLERVEQVINEASLSSVADLTVGGLTGLGLSGGQKKRLCIALQLVKMPSVIFLDEPTSGLDASASKELLTILNLLIQGGRSVLLTIHQPRVEIFHMFHKIVLLSNGEVTYFGSPFDALPYFKRTLMENSVPVKLSDVVSPADALLDLLTYQENQSILVNAYRTSGEPEAVRSAVLAARQSHANAPTATHIQNPGFWRRLMSLELRASLRQTWVQVVYIPVVFTVVAILISTIYYPADVGTKIVAVVCLTSCCSSLLMSSMVMGLLVKPLQIFTLEYSDGVSKPQDLVIHVFLRMAAISSLPLTLCMLVITLVLYQPQSALTVVFVILVFLLVNLCWINIFIFVTITFPNITHRISPLVAALGSFFCGFIIPRHQMEWYYRWILYLDPSYYAFSATSVAVFQSWGFCQNDHVECFAESSIAFISLFGLEDVNPIIHLIVLIVFVIALLLFSIVMLKVRIEHASILGGVWMLKNYCIRIVNRSRDGLGRSSADPNSVPVRSSNSSKQQKHQVVHTFKVWGAAANDNILEDDTGAKQMHGSTDLAQDEVSVEQYEVIDIQQSSQQRFLELMIERRAKMEQALVSMNQDIGDWLCADSEKNLLSMEDVGYNRQTKGGNNREDTDRRSGRSHSRDSPLYTSGKPSFYLDASDYGFSLPGSLRQDDEDSIL